MKLLLYVSLLIAIAREHLHAAPHHARVKDIGELYRSAKPYHEQPRS